MSFLGIKNPFRTGAGAATRAATDAAAAREGRAGNLTTLIGNIFADPAREARTADFMGALRSQLGDVTSRGYADTARNTKFATARQGLTGGSIDLSRQNRNLQDLFKRRIGDEAQVQDAGNGIRTQDEALKQSLIGQAYGTADVGQDAMRTLIGQRGENANYLSTLLPKHATDVANIWANYYGSNAGKGSFGAGFQAGGK
jgi:hypothetical protein